MRDVWWSTVLIPSIGRGRLCGSWLLMQGRGVFANSGAQGHATLGAVDVCLLLKCSNRSSDIDELVRRVIARGRESASVAENRVRKHFSDSVRSWDIVANLPQWLRGAVVEVNGMQVSQFVLSSWLTHSLLLLCLLAYVAICVTAAAQAQDVVLQHVEAALQPYMTETLPAHARSSPLSPH